MMVLSSSSWIILPSKGAPNPGPRQWPPSLSGSRGVALRLSWCILVLEVFFRSSVGARERIRQM
jgi:hypothetical protein